MSDQQHPMLPPDANATPEVDVARRRFAKAGLGSSVILATLASRPVLGSTCLTPSAAGSGNHSQHKPLQCAGGSNPQWWIDNVPRKNNGNPDLNKKWPGTNYKPNDDFHPLFSKGAYLNFMKNQNNSYTLWEVLNGQTPNAPIVPPNSLGKWFVAGLLSASNNQYAGVIQAIGPDPSVRGIEDEYATKGFFQATVGKQWGANTIIAYLQDPGSVF
jgi:hypothetical protein